MPSSLMKTLVLKHPQCPSSFPCVNIIIRFSDDGYKYAMKDTLFVQEALCRSFYLFYVSHFFSTLTKLKLFHSSTFSHRVYTQSGLSMWK